MQSSRMRVFQSEPDKTSAEELEQLIYRLNAAIALKQDRTSIIGKIVGMVEKAKNDGSLMYLVTRETFHPSTGICRHNIQIGLIILANTPESLFHLLFSEIVGEFVPMDFGDDLFFLAMRYRKDYIVAHLLMHGAKPYDCISENLSDVLLYALKDENKSNPACKVLRAYFLLRQTLDFTKPNDSKWSLKAAFSNNRNFSLKYLDLMVEELGFYNDHARQLCDQVVSLVNAEADFLDEDFVKNFRLHFEPTLRMVYSGVQEEVAVAKSLAIRMNGLSFI